MPLSPSSLSLFPIFNYLRQCRYRVDLIKVDP
jgi:hypothetical protein